MEIIDLTGRLLDSYNKNPKQNVIGRYSVSKLYSMLGADWLPPEKYLSTEPVDFEGAMNMWNGTWKHQMVQSLLPEYQKEIKKVMKFNIDGQQFEIVGMCDAIADDHGLEIKTSSKLHTDSKRWHDHQARIYCTMFEREVFKVVQPVVSKDKVQLNILKEIKRNDTWFNKEMVKLAAYHKELVAYAKAHPESLREKLQEQA